jgi:coenzyme F420-dependent glucose-6-phosphate dehydrogenase
VPSRIGYHCAHEQHAPSTLLENVRSAERAGFSAAMCSDHFMPWSHSSGQGHSGFTWSWLGAALQATELTFGTVTAPGQRYHPAILAQAIGTLAEMYPDRFWVAMGTGEALNEHITDEPWPEKPERRARLAECVDITRALLRGETVTHRGHVRVRDAKLYSRPETVPPIIGAALTPETARWVAGWADGLITTGADAAAMRTVIDAFREAGGDGKPIYVQVALAYARSMADAERVARDWKQLAVGNSDVKAEIELPQQFDAAARGVSHDELQKAVRIAASRAEVVDGLAADLALGIERIYVHQVGGSQADQDLFLTDLAADLVAL